MKTAEAGKEVGLYDIDGNPIRLGDRVLCLPANEERTIVIGSDSHNSHLFYVESVYQGEKTHWLLNKSRSNKMRVMS